MDDRLTEDLPFQVLRKEWQPVAVSEALKTGQVMDFVLLNTEIIIARLSTGLLVADNACSHKGAKLSIGVVCGDRLQCAYHGWQFDKDGNCMNIPSLVSAQEAKLRTSSLKKYEVTERYGMIWVQLEKDESVILPDIPEFQNPEWTYIIGPPTKFQSGFRREIENYLDMTHFAFAHGTTLGKAADAIVPKMDISVWKDGFQMDAPFRQYLLDRSIRAWPVS